MKNNNVFTFVFFSLYFITLFLVYKLSVPSEVKFNAGREDLILEFITKSNIVLWQISSFIAIVILIHILPLFVLIKSTKNISKHFSFSPTVKLLYFLCSLISMWFAVLAFNQIHFPRSGYSFLLFNNYNDKELHFIANLSLLIFVVTSVVPVFLNFANFKLRIKKIPSIIAIFLLLIFSLSHLMARTSAASIIGSDKPDIIMIGLDSVAPIHLKQHPNNLKKLKALIDSGQHFTNSVTPLARTFPSWVSILTGKNPVNTGARFNLTPLKLINQDPNLLPKLLKKKGYETIYAQDERKFNNINESFGFDSVVGPRIGASEFIITKISDIPFLNITLLMPGSEYLFPSIAINRAADIHYSPDKFVNVLLDKIKPKKQKPLFLATHLCLSHHPYKWRDYKGIAQNNSFADGHKKSMEGLEDQVFKLLDGLKKKGRLDNAILVILSDHGESLDYENGIWHDPLKGDQMYYPITKKESPIPLREGLSGHGTNIFSKSQYTTLLSFKGFGAQSKLFEKTKKTKITSLVDIYPTLLSSLNINFPKSIDGQELISDKKSSIEDERAVFTETGLTFSSLKSIDKIDEDKLLKEAKKFYTIDIETGLLILKQEKTDELISKKRYAIHTDNWILAFHRSIKTPPTTALIYKPTGEWTLGDNEKLISKAPLKMLVEKAKREYSNEINAFRNNWALKLYN